jgi:KDO2-lipid IV(A) lauroyltransferase
LRGRFRKIKRVLFHLAVRGLQLLARLPRRLALAALARVADLVYLLDRPAVRRSLAHLEIAFGSAMTAARRRDLVHAMFRATARNLLDVLRPFPREPREVARLVRLEGLENLVAALRRGRGVVALSAHLGNWEVLGAALAARGFPVDVVARRVFDPRSDRLLNAWRARCGVRVLPSDDRLAQAVRALRGGRVLGMLVDQDTPGPSLFAEFFGRPARTPRAPFVLARRTGAALVPMWIRMEPSGAHVASILPAIEPSAAVDPERALAADVAAWHRVLERAIRATPEQWVWHHRRWRTPPRAEVGVLRDPSRRLADPGRLRPTWEVAATR